MPELKIKLDDLETKISSQELQEEIIEIDFDGHLRIQITNADGELTITNAMNGYGYNCFDEYKGKKIIIG